MPPHSKDVLMKKHLQQYKASGQSLRAYCHGHNIKLHILTYYKKKFRAQSNKSATSNQLVPIKLVQPVQICNPITLRHTNGFSIEMDTAIEVEYLKPLLSLVNSIK